jgi:hypothetical protein
VPGPLTPAATSGPDGSYSSGLTLNADNTFTATYEFDSAAVAGTVANGGGERLLTWQVLDAAGNRQGVTIAELGELGGPGMGGCPAGPTAQIPPTPRGVSIVRSASRTSMQVDWPAVTAVPGADPVDGYSVELVSNTSSAAGRQQHGLRTPAGVTKATFGGLDPAENFTVEVRSMAAGHMSDAGVPSPLPDTTVPTLSATPEPSADGSAVEATAVTLHSNAPVYFTTDSSSPVNGDMPNDNAKLYAEPIPVPDTGTLQIRAAAFDAAGNHVEIQGFYKQPSAAAPAPEPAPVPTAAKPTGVTGIGGLHKVDLKWAAADAVTDYKVVATKAGDPTPVSTTQSKTNSVTVSGLAAGEKYTFTVAASNDGTRYGDPSDPTVAILATDAVTITSAKWKVGDLRVGGTGTDASPTGTVTLYNAANDAVIGTATGTTPAVAPASGMTFDIRLRAGVPNPKPARVYAKSSLGGVSPSFAVAG